MCLESIAKYAPEPYELIIVDNASEDETNKLLSTIENTKIIKNSENLGFIEAVNLGINQCKGEYTLLLNNDAQLHAQAIESALNTIESVP